jgi:putative transport protein
LIGVHVDHHMTREPQPWKPQRLVLQQQPMAALFLVIALGYLAGQIKLKGLSLGVGAVLFVALAVGWLAPKSVPAPAVGILAVFGR